MNTKSASAAALIVLSGLVAGCQTGTPTQEPPDLLNSTLELSDFGEGPIKLADGSFKDDSLDIHVVYAATGDVNGDGLLDGAVVINVNSGGTGQFRWLCLLVHDGEKLVHTDDAYIGDRVKVTRLGIDAETVTVDYLDRAKDDSFATAPYIKKTARYRVRGATLNRLP